MKRLTSFAAGLVCVATATSLAAQSYSARTVYPNPDGNMALFRNKPCQDPWVTIAVQIVYGTATLARCPIHLYNGGRWGSFNQLVHAVYAYKQGMTKERLTMSPKLLEGTNLVVPLLMDSNTGAIVAAGAGNLAPPNTAAIVAAGGGNLTGGRLIGNNGNTRRPSTLIGPDGATLIGNDAGSLGTLPMAQYRAVPKVTAAAPGTYVGLSSRTVRLPGGGMLVIK